MAEIFRKYFCMFPDLAYLKIEGIADIGTNVTIVTDEGTATAGALHAARLSKGKVTENFVNTGDLEENDILRSTIYCKFTQRDTYLNENPRHKFFNIMDNGGSNVIASLYYEGIDINNNVIGVEDSTGSSVVVDTGPYTANQWARFDCIYRHSSAVGMSIYKNGIFLGSTGVMDFHTTNGSITLKPQGQIENGPSGPGGVMFVSFLAHWTQVINEASTAYAKYLFRPYNHYGKDPICDWTGAPGGPSLFANTAAAIWDNAISTCAYRGSFTGDKQGGCWSSDRDIDRSGPHSRFAEGTVAVAATGCTWTDMNIKGGSDADPHLLFGRGNGDLTSFNIFEMDIDRGVNIKSQKLLFPGDTEFPAINDYAMIGFLNRQTVNPGTLSLEECLVSYLVEHPAPPLIQVRGLGEILGLGDMEVAG